MRVGIIGAGLSGLTAARSLVEGGHEVVVVEKSRGVGGRLAARRVGGTVVDHGAPTIDAPRGGTLAGLVDRFSDDAVPLGSDRVAYRSGATKLAKLMAAGVEVILSTRIVALRETRAGVELAGEQGNTHGVVDAVIVTAPAPQAADLLSAAGNLDARVERLREVRYQPAVMLLAGLSLPVPPAALDPFDVPDGLVRITNETAKGREPVDGVVPVVGRLDPAESARLLDASDADVLDAWLPTLRRACGAAEGACAWVQVKRWRYAVSESDLSFEELNPPGTRALVAGDSVATGLDGVARSGLRAARAVVFG